MTVIAYKGAQVPNYLGFFFRVDRPTAIINVLNALQNFFHVTKDKKSQRFKAGFGERSVVVEGKQFLPIPQCQ